MHKLPLNIDFETKPILKKSISANKALATLNGITKTLPNPEIMINTLILQEAKDSSEIENIITTHDEIYKSAIDESNISKETKEVNSYAKALKIGFELVKKEKLLLNRHIVQIQSILEDNNAGMRTQSGTVIKNMETNEIVHTPPQTKEEVLDYMANLEQFLNDNESELDPLVNMAIAHYQFEAIHPFYDGNGRTGRIINILYLILNDLLEIPILYLSGYIIKHKNDYYKLLQDIQFNDNWEEFVLYMLDGVEKVSLDTIRLIKQINQLMDETAIKIQEKHNKIYSKELLEMLFKRPYIDIEFASKELGKHRDTISPLLSKLAKIGILEKNKSGRKNYYKNVELFNLLVN